MKTQFVLIYLFYVVSFSALTQQVDTVIINQFNWRGCVYSGMPLYIVKSNHVIFQSCGIRKIIYPDINSFKNLKGTTSFAKDKDGIYFLGEFIKTDTTGFKILGSNRNHGGKGYYYFWKTKAKVYCNLKEIKKADAKTFVSINGTFYKDKKHVFYQNNIIKGSDGGSAKENGRYIYDKSNVYNFIGEVMCYKGDKLFRINDYFLKTKSTVINNQNKEIPYIDLKTIKKLSKHYSIDKNRLYFRDDSVLVKVNTLHDIKVWDKADEAFYSDGKKVYLASGYFEYDFDPNTFEIISNWSFCYDKNGVYERRWDAKLEKITVLKLPFNYKTLVTANNTVFSKKRYIIYNNQAYDCVKKVMLKNLASIKTDTNLTKNTIDNGKYLGDNFFIKENKIISNKKTLNFIDANTFVSFNSGLIKDKHNVWQLEHHGEWAKMNNVNVTEFKWLKYTPFTVDNSLLFSGLKQIAKGSDFEMLAIFSGYTPGCSQDPLPYTEYYFLKSTEGYWLIETTKEPTVQFLGKDFNANWNKIFENFEFPKSN